MEQVVKEICPTVGFVQFQPGSANVAEQQLPFSKTSAVAKRLRDIC